MRAVRFSEYGDADVLAVDEVPEPHAGPGQVRIAVRAAGVNAFDWKVRRGYLAGGAPLPAPAIPGIDAAGVVDEVGEGVAGVAVGDELFGFGVGGTYAEYALLADWAPKPPARSWEEAAGLPVPVETAVRTLDLLGVDEHGTLLIDGAAGGVGLAAVQFARARGARVIGTASPGNHALLRSLGAEPTTYGEGLVERVRALAPDGVDYALDTAGKGSVKDLIELTGDPEHVVSIADFSAPELGARVSDGSEGRSMHALTAASTLDIVIPIAASFALEQAADAHRASEAGHVRGKLVLVP